jgi:hypothetical protein
MNKLTILRNPALACAAATLLCGCLIDSVQPWLAPDTVMEGELDFEGDWELVSDDSKDKYAVTLTKDRDSRSIDKQNYYIKISPRNYNNRFHFRGVVHKVNGIKLLQITNFSHYHDDVIRLANRPTVSLWQIAYNNDNIIIWAPGFIRADVSTLETMRDSDDKLLFIDTTENLEGFIRNWTENYSETKDGVRNILPIILTRAGTDFTMPEEMQDLVPAVYKEMGQRGQ